MTENVCEIFALIGIKRHKMHQIRFRWCSVLNLMGSC